VDSTPAARATAAYGAAQARGRGWPRTLASRLFLIFLIGLVLANALSFALQSYERYESARTMMLGDLEHDVAVAFAVLDGLPASEREAWLPRLASRNRSYELGAGQADRPLTPRAAQAIQAVQAALGGAYPLKAGSVAGDPNHVQLVATLHDGTQAVLDLELAMPPMARWLPVVLLLQLALLAACAWVAVRLAIRPLSRLAQAADALDPDRLGPRVDERGPAEVAHAATAFNTMQDRIAAHLAERMRILGAISHDLLTPITRMKLRAEAMEDTLDKEKLSQDLNEVESLVREGLDYARSAHGSNEKAVRIDLDAFLESLAWDYQDTGKDVTLSGRSAAPLTTRPQVLRRILTNLVDNALKFAGAAQIEVRSNAPVGATSGNVLANPVSDVSIVVLDRGPGIPHEALQAVLQPFYRLEGSRSRDTGGTGLGLAIASQLATAIGGSLVLSNRDGGGLSAELRLADVA
jgi:signal transduction histidine kinase